MASLSRNRDGRYSIQYLQHGLRRTVYLGDIDKHLAEECARRVESLLRAAEQRQPVDAVTRAWLANLPAKLAGKLADKGLTLTAPVSTVEQLCQHVLDTATIEDSTRRKYLDVQANLSAFLGAGRSLHAVTRGDADAFRQWLLKQGRRPSGPLSPATVNKRCQTARQFFETAVRHRWIDGNPFAGLRPATGQSADREHFVDRETIGKLLEAATPRMRLILALARYAALRVPSEVYPLRWDWIDWDQGLLRVYAPKTKRFPDKQWRFVPICPELRSILAEAFESPQDPNHVAPADGATDAALRNRLERLCLRCGVLPWPKIWQNLRATRVTELADQFPIHVVCAWTGHAPAVAIKHYTQVTKEHVARVTSADECRTSETEPKSSAKSSALKRRHTSSNRVKLGKLDDA